MAYFLFVDESGQDRNSTPYEVLAGIAIQDIALWPLIQEIHQVEMKYFGNFYRNKQHELKAKKLLKTKTYRLATQLPRIEEDSLQRLAQACLEDGATARQPQITALAQAKIKYTEEVLQICIKYDCKVFASIIDYHAIETKPQFSDFVNLGFLRKDYSYLFERYYYFLEDLPSHEMGTVVFDEFERSKSHILVGQMSEYFIKTQKGKERSSYIIPEPLFVHSDLTTGIHVADLIAYCITWGFRIDSLTIPRRDELNALVDMICRMRYRARRIIPEIRSTPSDIWSIAVINS